MRNDRYIFFFYKRGFLDSFKNAQLNIAGVVRHQWPLLRGARWKSPLTRPSNLPRSTPTKSIGATRARISPWNSSIKVPTGITRSFLQQPNGLSANIWFNIWNSIGLGISTKAVGKFEREDITDHYKFKESKRSTLNPFIVLNYNPNFNNPQILPRNEKWSWGQSASAKAFSAAFISTRL